MAAAAVAVAAAIGTRNSACLAGLSVLLGWCCWPSPRPLSLGERRLEERDYEEDASA